MRPLQEWIHHLEAGQGANLMKIVLAVLAFVAAAVVFDIRCYRNFSTQEAMDNAQLARSLAEGQGYTTRFIRPLSLYLVKERNGNALLKSAHPDLANPPVYPALLAGLMKVLPMHYDIADASRANFSTYAPEVWIAIFNQVLFGCAVILLFRLGQRLFDPAVAWVSAIAFAGSELFWRFTVSGLSTLFLVVVTLGIASLLVSLEERSNQENERRGPSLIVASMIGLLLGIGGLTRYSFLWLLLPVIAFVALFVSRSRWQACLLIPAVSLGLAAPWLARDYRLSGNLFGTAGYAAAQGTVQFPGSSLERSLNPRERLQKIMLVDYVRKTMVNLRDIVRNDIPKFGGNWLGAFFLVGLLLAFKNRTLSRLRVFLVLSIALFFLVEAIGRTHLSAASPEINSENLLVLFAPLVFVFGVGLYAILLEQLVLPLPELRHAVTGMFLIVMSAPLLFALLPPRSSPLAYPPYLPPHIQEMSRLMKERELMMSDVPWAIAWYGGRQCSWLTLNPREDFFKLNDELKPVGGLYLSPLTTESKLISEILRDKESWGYFVYQIFARSEVPPHFPLQKSPGLSDRLFLSDWERWKVPPKP